MLIITAQIFTDSDTLSDLYARLKALVEPTRAEAGCLFYHMAMEDADKGTILALEGWRDQQALDHHLSLPDVARLLRDFDGKYSNTVQLHTVSHTQQLVL